MACFCNIVLRNMYSIPGDIVKQYFKVWCLSPLEGAIKQLWQQLSVTNENRRGERQPALSPNKSSAAGPYLPAHQESGN